MFPSWTLRHWAPSPAPLGQMSSQVTFSLRNSDSSTKARRLSFGADRANIDADRLGDALEETVTLESHAERLQVAGAGARRGVILHKIIEELLTGELAEDLDASVARARELLNQLTSGAEDDRARPDPNEMATAALRALALPEIAELRPFLVPEIPIWAKEEDGLVAGRADALAVSGQRVDSAIDWKSDVNPTLAVREAHAQQLRDYLSATNASRGAIVYLSSGEIVWVRKEEANE
jgi:hypothetical protein